MKKVSVSLILNGRLCGHGGRWSISQRHSFLSFIFSCYSSVLGRCLGKEIPFLAFDLHGGLHFPSNSKSQIISLQFISNGRQYLNKKKVSRCFQLFQEESNGDFDGSKAFTDLSAKVLKIKTCYIIWETHIHTKKIIWHMRGHACVFHTSKFVNQIIVINNWNMNVLCPYQYFHSQTNVCLI